ncbi:hypothetical protein HW560_29955 [Paenibacillus sp. E222]|uniref:hypothetical protein n=1 Tax=Paenibacillus sp. E222 TaxID=2748863 RepID=UPI0015C628A9|nr:hypothetical protein [Paenibacillus sp. E222]QLG41934.1 hypothetical protein HW560_29955 [Paenibacillus sp. E222]
MRINKRLSVESLLVTLLFTLGFMAWNVVQGMLMTLNHTPEMNNDSSVTLLQSKVALAPLPAGTRLPFSSLLLDFSCLLLHIMDFDRGYSAGQSVPEVGLVY